MPKKPDEQKPIRRRAPATTPAGREEQLIALAVDVAEARLIDGTASNQLVCHFLALGSTKAQLEKKRLEGENDLLRAKVESLKSAGRVEELYANALEAMRSYSGSIKRPDDDEELY